MLFSRDPEADRAFFTNVLERPHVDAGGGWLIFKLPPAEMAMHPTDGPSGHELYFMCDDVEATMRELRAKGVEFTQDISEEKVGPAHPVPAARRRRRRHVRAPPPARNRPVNGDRRRGPQRSRS